MKSMELVIIYISGKSGPLIFKYLILARIAKQATEIQFVICSQMLLFFFYSNSSKMTNLKQKF